MASCFGGKLKSRSTVCSDWPLSVDVVLDRHQFNADHDHSCENTQSIAVTPPGGWSVNDCARGFLFIYFNFLKHAISQHICIITVSLCVTTEVFEGVAASMLTCTEQVKFMLLASLRSTAPYDLLAESRGLCF